MEVILSFYHFIVDFDKLITHVVGVVFQYVIGRHKQVTKIFHRNKGKFQFLPHVTHVTNIFLYIISYL